MGGFKKKFKVLKEGLGIDYNSLDNALFEQNLLMTKLREENETLKDNVEFLHSCLDDRDKSIQYAKEENQNLKRELDVVKGIKNSTVNVLINNDTKIKELEKENRKLNERIKELEQCNLSLQTWIDKKERVNESLRKELDFYRNQDKHTMGED